MWENQTSGHKNLNLDTVYVNYVVHFPCTQKPGGVARLVHMVAWALTTVPYQYIGMVCVQIKDLPCIQSFCTTAILAITVKRDVSLYQHVALVKLMLVGHWKGLVKPVPYQTTANTSSLYLTFIFYIGNLYMESHTTEIVIILCM